jgi:hypothetical protein
MSSAELICIAAAVWFVGAVPVSLAVGRVLRRRGERGANSRPSSAAGRHRRRTVTAGKLLAQPTLQDSAVVVAEAPGERGENPLEPYPPLQQDRLVSS